MTAIDRSPSLSPWDTTSGALVSKCPPLISQDYMQTCSTSSPSTPHAALPTDLRSTSTVTEVSPSATATSTSTSPSVVTSAPSTPRASDAAIAQTPARSSKHFHTLLSHPSVSEKLTPSSSVMVIENSQHQHQHQHQHHVRALPRCAVVNFKKDGDNLNWKPRVAQNLSGLPARAHNFEDAFSLEEFSSTTLPVVWTATGGNPRLSITDVASDDQLDPRQHLDCSDRYALSNCATHAASTSPSQVTESSEKCPSFVESSQHLDEGMLQDQQTNPDRPRQNGWNKSPSNRQMSFSANLNCPKTLSLANELRRPSFWSFLTHSRNYQQNRVRARIQTSDDVDRRREFASSPGFRKAKGDTGNQGQISSTDSRDKVPSDADSSARVSLLRKLVSKFERRSTPNLAISTGIPASCAQTCNGQKSSKSGNASLSDRSGTDSDPHTTNTTSSTNKHSKFNGASRDRPVRMRSKWSSAEGGPRKLNLFAGRRSKSNLAAVVESKKQEDYPNASKDGWSCGKDDGHCGNVVVNDDQYVKFMTTVK